MINESKPGRSRGLNAVLFVVAFFLMIISVRMCSDVAIQHAPVSPEVNNIVNEYTRKAAAIAADYDESLDRIGWYAILDPSRLSGDNGLGESRRIIAEVRESLDEYERRGDEMSRALAKSVDDLNISSLETTDFLKRLSSTREMASNARRESLDLEAQIMTEVEKIIDLIDSQSQAVTFTESEILFSSEEVADEYNSKLDNIDLLLLKQGQLAEDLANAQRTN